LTGLGITGECVIAGELIVELVEDWLEELIDEDTLDERGVEGLFNDTELTVAEVTEGEAGNDCSCLR